MITAKTRGQPDPRWNRLGCLTGS